MLHKVNVRIDAGKLKEQPLLPEVLQILKVVRPAWLPENICRKQLIGGITNLLYAYYEEGKFDEDVVLIRVYGEGSEQWMDRPQEKLNMQAVTRVLYIGCIETQAFSRQLTSMLSRSGVIMRHCISTYFEKLILKMVLHEAGCCAPLYAEFDNGVAMGYVQGEMLDLDSVRDKRIGKLIAKEMCRLHTLRPKPKDPPYDMWGFGEVLLSLIPEGFPDDPEKHKRYVEGTRPRHVLQEEFRNLRDHLEALNSPKVFCHNDLLHLNIIYDKDKDQIHFIDFEVATYNYEHFEVAQHFCEYIGVTKDLDFTRHPDKAHQIEWIRTYLGYRSELNGGSQEDVSDSDVEEFYVKCSKFQLVVRFIAGIWGFVQSISSKLDYDHLHFGLQQLGEYFARKDEILALQLP